MEITSTNNELVKETAKLQQKKYRDSEGLFLLEGFKAIEEAHLSGIKIIRYFVEKPKRGKYLFLKGECIETNSAVLGKISTTTTPPEIVAVAQKPQNDNKTIGNKVVLFENIKDLGNLGTIIRTAVAFDVDGIILYGNTVDLYNPKVVRATVGNLWKINIVEVSNFEELSKMLSDYQRIGTLPKSDNSEYLSDFRLKGSKNVIMFGEESTGLSQDLKEFATQNVTIEMSKNVESLNLSISAGILMYKIFK